MKKKEIVETRTGSFIDYTGATRNYVIAAVSEILPEILIDEEDNEIDIDNLVLACNLEANTIVDSVDRVVKRVSIGFAICSAEDTFNEKLGIEIATGKAHKKPTGVLYVTDLGMINTALVDALLKQEMSYFEDNPGHAIAGYNKAKADYESKQQ